MIGTRVGYYAIQEKLGEGGMGIVYKAHDTRLLRAVAVKILPPHLITDEKNRLRFIHEAQAASALNHPNICTIHDIGEDNGVHFIVMELVEGQTLRERLAKRGALPEAEVIRIALQVCEALAAAHAKGIIHRDIKPENLMLTPAGVVKVMDFGLAKLLADEAAGARSEEILSPTDEVHLASFATHLRTSFSALPGTAAYMAPEQIRRQSLDGRADQFALGVVMYELLTGVHPFQRDEQMATMKAILHNVPISLRSVRSPAPLRGVFKQSPTRGEDYEKSGELRSALSITPATEKIVLRCLAKNINGRYENMARLREALVEISNAAAQREKKSLRRWAALFAAGLFVLVAGVTGFLFQESFLQKEIRAVPTLNIHEISRFHARYTPFFVGNDDNLAMLGQWKKATHDTFSLWLKHPDSSAIKHVLSFSMPDADDNFGDLSPDGRQFVFSSHSAQQKGIFLIEKGQRQPRRLVDFGYWPKWSPDGRQIVFARVDWNEVGVRNAVYLYEIESGMLRQLSPENGRFYAGPSWSPDGKWILCAGGLGSLWEIWMLSAATGEAQQLSNFGGWVKWPMWSQADAAIYFLFEKNGSTNLWRTELDTCILKLGSSLRQMTTGTPIRFPSMSRTGDRFVFESLRGEGRLEWMPLSEPSVVRWEKRTIASPPLPELVEFTLSPDGEQVALEQPRSGRKSIIVFSFFTQTEQIIYNEQDAFSPAWSADGKWIAFDAGGGDRADIWRVPATGGTAEKIVEHPGADWLPTYSPDGQYLCFLSNRSGQFDLWLMDLHTGETTKLTNTPGNESRGFWSHDASKLAFFQNYPEQGNAVVCVYDFLQKRQRAVHWFSQADLGMEAASEISVLRKMAWSQDGRKLYFAKTELLELDLASLAVQPALIHKPGSLPAPSLQVGVVGDRLYLLVSYSESINTYLAEIVR